MERDELFRTLKRAVAGSFEVLAELGRGQGGRYAYVAREVSGGGLVVLELNLEDSDPDGTPNFGLFIRRELDASIPALSLECDQCGAAVGGWSRYCPNCSADLSGVANTTGGRSAAELFRTGALGGQDRYEFLGEMPRAEGGGAVYFARERGSGRLVALRVEREGPAPDAGYRLTTTQTMLAVPSPGTTPTPRQRPKVAWREPEEASGQTSPAAPTAAAGGATRGTAGQGTGTGGYCPLCGTTYEAGIWFCPRDGSPVKPTVTTDKLIGQTIAGRFRVERKLGSGGMGTVYLAEHVRMGRPCALKIMNASLRDDPEALGRFGREAANASRITHPNVAAIYDFGEAEDGTVYLAMEFADGESLGALMKREGAIAPGRAVELVAQVLDGLAAAHAIGIVHRDLKPDNIILARTPTGKQLAKVVDFGIAKAMQVTDSQQLTRTGFVVGTPRYMSPEQITGGTIDGRTDLYSAACILFELLVGAVPFSGPSGEVTITRRLTEPPPHPRRINGAIDKRLDQVVVRAMAREPESRYHTVEEFRAALAEATRPDVTAVWARGWQSAAGRAAGLAAAARGAVAGAGRSAVRGIGSGARAAGSAAGRTGRASAGALHAAGAAFGRVVRGLGRLLRPLASWQFAAAVVVLAVLGAGTPTVVGWLAARREAAPPDTVAGAGSLAEGDVAPAGQPPQSAPSAASEPAATLGTGGAPGPASAGTGSPERLPAVPTATAPPAAASGTPIPVPAVVPAAVLDSMRAKLRLAALLLEEEAYADVFEQLRLVRTRLDALRTEYPDAASLRQVRSQHERAVASATSQCEAVRRVALQVGETPPVCR